jgi:hypothetical protein
MNATDHQAVVSAGRTHPNTPHRKAVMNTHTQAAELLARVRSGDCEALGELYVRYRPVMEGYLTRRMPMCPGDVEDVLQDAFVRVMESPHQESA